MEWLVRMLIGLCVRKSANRVEECSNYWGISLLSVVGFCLWGILVICISSSSIDGAIGKEQCVFRKIMGRAD